MKKGAFAVFGFLFLYTVAFCQALRPGFDKAEYVALLKVSAQFGSAAYARELSPPQGYRMIYRSPAMGLDNQWDFWQSDNGAGIISIRGTTQKETSWLANFYAAMVPAKGTLQISKTQTFRYNLSDNPRAAVHAGWLVSTGFLAGDMLPKIDSAYKSGLRNIYITGHSQGGAIAFLLTAYLRQLQKAGTLPGDLRFKTYCSAGPKPGNLYFAFDYEAATQAGWAYNVVNAADWVPQSPFSVQTVADFAAINPFINANTLIKQQKWPKRWILNIAYNRLNKPSKQTADQYKKYLGGYVAKSIQKVLVGFKEPVYANTSDYVRTGNTIVLMPHEDYYRKFPQDQNKLFVNHFHQPYLYLTEQLDIDGNSTTALLPDGTWELTNIEGGQADTLFARNRPSLRFDRNSQRISGNTGCNNFNAALQIEGSTLRIPEPIATTRMACEGKGEQLFLQTLTKANAYSLEGDKLTLLRDGYSVLQFAKK